MKSTFGRILLFLIKLSLCAVSCPLAAQDLGSGGFQIVGTALDASPEAQAVPLNVPTVIHTTLPANGAPVPADLLVRAELTGPGLASPVELTTVPNGDLRIPPLSVKGDYSVTDIRLTQADRVLAYAAHRNAAITVTDVLVTQVTSRPLTYEELIDKGIVTAPGDFSGYNFSFAITLDSNTVVFDVPVLFTPSGAPILPTPPVQSGTPPGAEYFRPPQVDPIDLRGSGFIPPVSVDGEDVEIHIPTLLLIPGDVAFLNQFFSVSIMVQNGAPAGSNLTLQNVTATPRFPAEVQVKSSTPPVNLGDPVPVRDPGPDGILGTADDITFLVGQARGDAEFVVEGLRSGTFDVPIDVAATLEGLPTGPMTLAGQAHGTILVRHPSFFVTFDHPDTVREGQTYAVNATVTNTSSTPAEQVSIRLDANSVSGAQLLSDETVAMGDIAPNDNAVATFQFVALRTGRVTSTATFSEGSLSGAIILATAVDDLGAAVSPDTLVLPTDVGSLPIALVTPARQLLGLGWSLAKSPPGTTDPALPEVGEQGVNWRVSDLAIAARHQTLGEAPEVALSEWVLEWLNANSATASNGFDELRRISDKGGRLGAAIGSQLAIELAGRGPADLEAELASSLPELPHLAAVLSLGNSDDPTARLEISKPDAAEQTVGSPGEDGYLRGVPNGEIFEVGASELGWVGNPQLGTYRVAILGKKSGTTDLVVFVPGPEGATIRETFRAIPVQAGSLFFVDVSPGPAPSTAVLNGIPTGPVNGTLDVLAEPGASLLAATQDLSADPLGRAISLLFNRALVADPSRAGYAANQKIVNERVAAIAEDPVVIGVPQANDPRRLILGVQNHPSPYESWTVETHGLVFSTGSALDPAAQTLPVAIEDQTPGGSIEGVVIGADGKPIANAEVVLRESETSDTTGATFLDDFALATADGTGQYRFDYVPLRQGQVFELDATDPESGFGGSAFGQLQQARETLHVNIVLLGRGDIRGVVRDESGTPLAGAFITASSEFFPSNQGSTNSASDGSYSFASFPVGPVQLWAIYQSPAALKTAYQAAYIAAPGGIAQQDIVVAIGGAGAVSGVVTHESGGQPASGLYVVIYGQPVSVPWFPFSQRQYFGFQITDGSGQYRFPAVSPGSDEIQVYDPARGWQVVADETVTVLADDENRFDFVELDPTRHTGSVSGHVYVNAGGTLSPDPNGLVWLSNSGLQVTTDESGAYRLDGVPTGNQAVLAYDQVLKLGQQSGVTVQEGLNSTLDLTLVATVPAGVSGSVVDPLGNPVPGAEVAYFDGAGAIVAGTTADGSGSFSFQSLVAGNYRLWAYGMDVSTGVRRPDVGYGDVTVSSGRVVAVVVSLLGYGAISGQVTSAHIDDGGNPIDSPVEAHMTLSVPQILMVGPYARIVNPGEDVYPGPLETDSASDTGKYSFSPILLGSGTLLVHHPIFGDQSKPIRLDHVEQVATYNFQYQGASSIDGFLYDEKGNPVGGASVWLYSNDQPIASVVTSSRTTDPEGLGYFRFAAVPGNTTHVQFDGLADNQERFAIAHVSIPSNPISIRVTLRCGRVQDVKVAVIEPLSGVLQPIAGAAVSISESAFPQRTLRSSTASDGTVTFPGLSEGAYTVRAQSIDHVGSAGGCVCDEGNVSQTTITLSGSGKVGGFVRFPSTLLPVGNVQILLHASGLIGAAQTDESGAYEVDGLPLGTALWVGARDNASGRSGASPTFVLAADGDSAEQDITLIALGAVTGKFTDSAGVDPIIGATITLSSSSSIGSATLRSGTDATGTYSFGGIPQGSFSLQAADAQDLLKASGTGEIDSEQQVVAVNLRAEPTGSLDVQVLDSSGNSLPTSRPPPILTISGKGDVRTLVAGHAHFDTIPVDVTYSVTAEEQASPPHHLAAGTASISSAGQDGVLSVTYVPYGDVAVHVVRLNPDGNPAPVSSGRVTLTSDGLYGSQFPFGSWVNVDSSGEADFVQVGGSVVATYRDDATGATGSASGAVTAEGERVDLTVSIAGTASIQGSVLKPDGTTPDSGVTVVLTGPNTPSRAAMTDPAGNYRIDGVPYGTDLLTFSDQVIPAMARAAISPSAAVASTGVFNAGSVVLDGTPPTITASSLPAGAIDVPTRPVIQFAFSEPVNILHAFNVASPDSTSHALATVSADHLSATWQLDTTFGAKLNPGETYVLSVPAGSYEDFNGMPGVAFSLTFSTIDNVGPSVAVTVPAAGQVQVGTQPTIEIGLDQAVDPASVSASSVTVTKLVPSAGVVAGTVQLVSNLQSITFTPAAPGLDPQALYEVNVNNLRDTSGNLMVEPYTFSFWTLDNQPPAIHFSSSPATMLTLHPYSFTIALDSPDVARVDVEINGTGLASFHQVIGDTSRQFGYTVPLSPAGSTLVVDVTATDFSGNTCQPVELRIPVSVDAPPTATITLDPDGPVSAGQSVIARVNVADDIGLKFATLRVSGLATGSCSIPASGQTSGAGTCTVAVPLSAAAGGSVNFAVDLSDGYQEVQSGATTLTVDRDSLPPTIVQVLPGDGSSFASGSTVPVSVSAADDVAVAQVTATLAGHSLSFQGPVGSGSFTAPIVAAAEDVPLTVTVSDYAGNKASRVVTLTIRPDLPPSGTLSLSPAGPVLPGHVVNAKISAVDDFGIASISVSVFGALTAEQTAEVSGTSVSQSFPFVLPITAAAGSTVTFVAVVRDSVGQTTTLSAMTATVAQDVAPPTITLTAPQDGAAYVSGDTISLSGTATDDVGVKEIDFVVDGATTTVSPPFEGGVYAATMTVTAKLVTTPTQIAVRIVVRDFSGNSSEKDFHLEIEPLQNSNSPGVTFLCPSAWAMYPAGYTATVSVSASDDQAVDRVDFILGDGAEPFVSISVPSSGDTYTANFSIPATTPAGTVLVLHARAYDFADNSTDASVPITVVAGDTFSAPQSFISADDLTHEGHLLIVTSGTLTINGKHSFGGLSILPGATLTESPLSSDTSGVLDLTIGSSGIYVACGASISVAGAGYPGGISGRNGQTYSGVVGSGAWSGGSHGGLGTGSAPNGTTSGGAYGSVAEPAELGGGGGGGSGFYGGYPGGNGGGALFLTASAIALDGEVVADGAGGNPAGGGGGSVRIDAGTLAGRGMIRAEGGPNAPGVGHGVFGEPGGGGRISIFADASGFDRDHLIVSGGAATVFSTSGGAGTIYLKSGAQAHGDLIVDNEGLTNESLTPLICVGSGTVTSAGTSGDGVSLSDSSRDLPFGAIGEFLEISRGGVSVGRWRINAYGADIHTLVLDLAADVKAGDHYQGTYLFDSVSVRGNSFVRITDPVVASSVTVAADSVLEDPARDSPPTGTFTLSPAGTILSGSVLQVTVQATDDFSVTSIHLLVSGAVSSDQTAGITGTSVTKTFSVPVGASAQGQIRVDITLSDDFGHSAALPEQLITASSDHPPSVGISTTPSGQIGAGMTLHVVISLADDFGLASMRLIASGAALLDQTRSLAGITSIQSFDLAIPKTAANGAAIVLNASATDSAGHVTNADPVDVLVSPDVTPPEITIDDPAGAVTVHSGDDLIVDGEVADSVGVASASLSFGDESIELGTNSFFEELTVPSVSSETELPVTVQAVDFAGNVSQKSVAVTIEPGRTPVVTASCPTDGAMFPAGYTIPITVIASSDLELDRVSFVRDGESDPFATVPVNGNAQAVNSTYVIPAGTPDGTSLGFTAIAYNSSGDSGSTHVGFLVVGGDIFTGNRTISATDTSHEGHTVIVEPGTLTIDGHHQFNGLVVLAYATVAPVAPTSTYVGAVDIDAGYRGVYVMCAGQINATGLGFVGAGASGTPPAQSFPGVAASGTGTAGSHGGIGQSASGEAVPAFGSVFVPGEAGGGGGSSSQKPGGNGGGVVSLSGEAVVLDGRLQADGGSGLTVGSAGAGGSLRVSAATVTGSGAISANGAVAGFSPSLASGGGRIAIDAGNFSMARDLITANPEGQGAGSGTMLIRSSSELYGDLFVTNNSEFGAQSSTPLVSAGAGTVTESSTEVDGIHLRDSTKAFSYSVAGEYLRIFRNGGVVGEWKVLGPGADGQTLVLDSAGDVQIGDEYQGVYRFDSITVSGGGFLTSTDPVIAGTVSVGYGSRFEAPNTNQPPTVSGVIDPPAEALPGGVVGVLVTAMDDIDVARIEVSTSGASLFEQVVNESGTTASHYFPIPVPRDAHAGDVIAIVMRAWDDLGAEADSSLSIVVTADTVAPTILLASPGIGEVFGPNDLVAARAEVFDNIGIASATATFNGVTQSFDMSLDGQVEVDFAPPSVMQAAEMTVTFDAQDYAGNRTEKSVPIVIRPFEPLSVEFACPSNGAMLPPGYKLDVWPYISGDVAFQRIDVFISNLSTPLVSYTIDSYDPSVPVVSYTIPSSAADGASIPMKLRVTDVNGVVSQAQISIQVVRGDELTADTIIGAADMSREGHLVVLRSGTLTIDGHHAFAGLVVLDGVVTGVSPTPGRPGKVDVAVGARGLYLSCNGTIDVSYESAEPAGAAPDPFLPMTAGAAGSDGLLGGGIITLNGSTAVLDGFLWARGEDASDSLDNCGATAGSGGSISLQFNSIGSGGAIIASGGWVSGDCPDDAPGNGGAIAVAGLPDEAYEGGFIVDGGEPSENGSSPGIVVLRGPEDRYGRMFLRRENFGGTSIVIPSVGAGVISSVGTMTVGGQTYATLTDDSRTFSSSIVGYFIAVGGDTSNLYAIVAASGNTLTVAPDVNVPPFSAQAGASYSGVLRLDSISVEWGVHATTADYLLVPFGSVFVDATSGASLIAKNYP